MKWKYFLRGLGAGIIFSALVILVAFMTSEYGNLTDKEIIEKAKKLGMVEKSSVLVDDTTEVADKTTNDEAIEATETDSTKNESKTTEETAEVIDKTTEETTEVIDKTTEVVDKTTNETTTEKTDATTENDKTYKDENDKKDDELVTAKISVTSGMSSTSVAQLLMDADIIKDANDFDNYLVSKGYSTRIRIAEYTFTSNMTYEEIAQRLMKVNE